MKVPSPVRRIVAVTGASLARKSTKSTVPPSKRKVSLVGSPSRPSTTVMASPGMRKAVWRTRETSSP